MGLRSAGPSVPQSGAWKIHSLIQQDFNVTPSETLRSQYGFNPGEKCIFDPADALLEILELLL